MSRVKDEIIAMGPMPPIIAVTTWASLYFMLGPVALPLGLARAALAAPARCTRLTRR